MTFPAFPSIHYWRILQGLLITTILVLLTGCTPPAGPEGESPQNITFMILGDPEELRAYETLVTEFKKDTTGVEVSLIHVPSGGEFRQKLATMFSAGTPPDVFLYNFRRLGVYMNENAIHPVDSLLDNSEVLNRDDYYQIALDAFTYQGALQCMPQNISSPVIYYNKALFDAAGLAYPHTGWTLDDFLATARALTKDTNGDGTIDQYGFGTAVETIRLAPFLWQNGGQFLDDPTNPTELTLDTPEAREVLQWFVDLQVKEHVVPDAVAEEAISSENRFLTGTLGMYMDSRVAVPTLRTIQAFEWDAASLPVGKTTMSVLHSDGFCISEKAASDSAHLTAVWKFVEYSLSEKGQIILAATGRTVPSMKKVAESAEFLQSSPPANNIIWLEATASMQAFPIHPRWNVIEEMFSKELQRAFYGNATVDEILDAAEKATTEMLTGN